MGWVCVGCAYVCGVLVFCVVKVRWVCVWVGCVCALGVRVCFAFLCVVCVVLFVWFMFCVCGVCGV